MRKVLLLFLLSVRLPGLRLNLTPLPNAPPPASKAYRRCRAAVRSNEAEGRTIFTAIVLMIVFLLGLE